MRFFFLFFASMFFYSALHADFIITSAPEGVSECRNHGIVVISQGRALTVKVYAEGSVSVKLFFEQEDTPVATQTGIAPDVFYFSRLKAGTYVVQAEMVDGKVFVETVDIE